MARIVSGPLSEWLGRTVIVENRPGAGGTIGADYVVHAKPDGSVILLAAPTEIVDPGAILHEMRLRKSPGEVETMRQAAMYWPS